MDELKNLVDVVYNHREVVSVGAGSIAGISCAIYDQIRGRRKEVIKAAGLVAAFSAIYNPTDDGFLRSSGNFIVGGVTYSLFYEGAYRFIDTIKRNLDWSDVE